MPDPAELYDLEDDAELDSPVLVMALDGWIDAGLGASAAMATILESMPNQPVATFDADTLLDHRSRRPVLHLVDGVHRGLTWPVPQLLRAEDRLGNQLLLLVGPEPDHYWRAFTTAVVDLARQLGVRLAVGLGAFPAPVPHTRPVKLTSTASTPELAAQVGFMPGTIDVPAGVQAALEQGLAEGGIPSVGLWARVPHYISAMPFPAASLALLDGLASMAGIEVHAGTLRAAAAVSRQRVDELVAGNDEHTAMVRRLEEQVDAEVESIDPMNLPSGDEIAAEFQRFLREEGGG